MATAAHAAFSPVEITPDWEGFVRTIRRERVPDRVHFIELFIDPEVQEAIARRYGLLDGLRRDDPHWDEQFQIRLQRFLGYDYVRATCEGLAMRLKVLNAEDTSALKRAGGRQYVDEHKGPVTNWDEFEKFDWSRVEHITTRQLEYFEKHLPDDMCVVAFGQIGHYAEMLNWLMGYETLCFALFNDRELVRAMFERLDHLYQAAVRTIVQFDRVKVIWGSDDMGFRSGTLISPADLREFVLPGHKALARIAHDAGRPYILHSCGKLSPILPDLVDDVRIDGKHSFEDTIGSVIEFKRKYGHKVAALGGIDVDFLCRSDEAAIRRRVRETLAACQSEGGYCLGSGNSICNYIPVDHYLAMLDEGRKWRG
ncbi:MAG TPA: uroporphyrinogen decarboxylase family protein [Candidatus Sumerlaeota bacterium]|nr:uroporphyrinogen decarboxylase family protein [Candidatus Sumerlaeota bacterium]HOR27617.1 uroporphyrinogen decarboxylase family protein [Candidatus Sumerlaeota bacterium]HPK01150.1 uroporphyrinogen decarboxylase family protein [Candidatus Sumerlaeota bacterium]